MRRWSKAGNKLPTIGEAVHRSAIDRFNRDREGVHGR